MNKNAFLWLGFGILTLLNACAKKTAPAIEEPASSCESGYTKHIKPFIISKCAIQSCHVANFPFGDFTGYGDLKSRINSGRINTLVFEQKLMPPSGSPQLTADELDKFKCWIGHDAPED